MADERKPDSNKSGQAKRNLPPDSARGELIRRLMDEQGWTESRLAKDIDVSVSSISMWKRGKAMRREHVARLAGALKIDPAELIGDFDELVETAEERIARAVWGGDDRRQGGVMRGFPSLMARLNELRGEDPEASLTSLRADVQDLRALLADLLEALHEQGVLGEPAEGAAGDRSSGESEDTGPATSSS